MGLGWGLGVGWGWGWGCWLPSYQSSVRLTKSLMMGCLGAAPMKEGRKTRPVSTGSLPSRATLCGTAKGATKRVCAKMILRTW